MVRGPQKPWLGPKLLRLTIRFKGASAHSVSNVEEIVIVARTGETVEALQQRKTELLANRVTLNSTLATISAQLRTRNRENRLKRQAVVGKLAAEAGLLAYDLETLQTAFQQLAVTLGEITK